MAKTSANQTDDAQELEALRRSVQRGRPFGQPEWQKEIAKRLGLESAYRPTGRPRRVAEIKMPRPGEDRSDVGGAAQFNNIGPVPLSPPRPAFSPGSARRRAGRTRGEKSAPPARAVRSYVAGHFADLDHIVARTRTGDRQRCVVLCPGHRGTVSPIHGNKRGRSGDAACCVPFVPLLVLAPEFWLNLFAWPSKHPAALGPARKRRVQVGRASLPTSSRTIVSCVPCLRG